MTSLAAEAAGRAGLCLDCRRGVQGRDFPVRAGVSAAGQCRGGDSVGHWEGDTLVIDTLSVERPGVGPMPLPMVSEQARYVERLRMVTPDRIESVMTVTDPATLTQPWVIKLSYKREPAISQRVRQ